MSQHLTDSQHPHAKRNNLTFQCQTKYMADILILILITSDKIRVKTDHSWSPAPLFYTWCLKQNTVSDGMERAKVCLAGKMKEQNVFFFSRYNIFTS